MRTATPAKGKRSRQSLLRARASEDAPIPPRAKTVASARAALPRTAFSPISNRNKTAFKIRRNPMKTKAAPLSNRNTNPVSARPPAGGRSFHTAQTIVVELSGAAAGGVDRGPVRPRSVTGEHDITLLASCAFRAGLYFAACNAWRVQSYGERCVPAR